MHRADELSLSHPPHHTASTAERYAREQSTASAGSIRRAPRAEESPRTHAELEARVDELEAELLELRATLKELVSWSAVASTCLGEIASRTR